MTRTAQVNEEQYAHNSNHLQAQGFTPEQQVGVGCSVEDYVRSGGSAGLEAGPSAVLGTDHHHADYAGGFAYCWIG